MRLVCQNFAQFRFDTAANELAEVEMFVIFILGDVDQLVANAARDSQPRMQLVSRSRVVRDRVPSPGHGPRLVHATPRSHVRATTTSLSHWRLETLAQCSSRPYSQ